MWNLYLWKEIAKQKRLDRLSVMDQQMCVENRSGGTPGVAHGHASHNVVTVNSGDAVELQQNNENSIHSHALNGDPHWVREHLYGGNESGDDRGGNNPVSAVRSHHHDNPPPSRMQHSNEPQTSSYIQNSSSGTVQPLPLPSTKVSTSRLFRAQRFLVPKFLALVGVIGGSSPWLAVERVIVLSTKYIFHGGEEDYDLWIAYLIVTGIWIAVLLFVGLVSKTDVFSGIYDFCDFVDDEDYDRRYWSNMGYGDVRFANKRTRSMMSVDSASASGGLESGGGGGNSKAECVPQYAESVPQNAIAAGGNTGSTNGMKDGTIPNATVERGNRNTNPNAVLHDGGLHDGGLDVGTNSSGRGRGLVTNPSGTRTRK
jgi:hypothetical protein